MFQTHENLEHLAMMERVLGPIPHHMLKRVECVPLRKFYVILFSDSPIVNFFLLVLIFGSADMPRSTSEEADWIGLRVQPRGRVSKLF